MNEPMMQNKLVVMRDPVAEVLDDMAALGEYWQRNREKGRMPGSIRAAMLLAAREAIMVEEMEQASRLTPP